MFGDRLKQARVAAKMTQQELGEKIGAKGNSVSNWEKGVSRPDLEQVGKICTVLNVSANFLIDTSEISTTISAKERMLLNKYNALDIYGKELIELAIDCEYRRCESQNNEIHTTPAIRAARSFGNVSKIDRNADIDEQKFIDAPENDIDM